MNTDPPDPRRILRLFDLNPDYGTGAFRRLLRFRHHAGVVDGALDDNNHAMWMRLRHQAGTITAVDSGFHRWPTTACPGAVDVLQELVGLPIAISRADLLANDRARRHCTHLLDLTTFALHFAAEREGTRTWDAVVPDARDGIATATITLDGDVVHRWTIRDHVTICADDGTQPSLLRGFTPWASARFAGLALHAAIILRMTAFTARARAHITDNYAWPLAAFPEREGACHAYASSRIDRAVHRLDVVKDLSSGT